jgi:hypothetical protein
MLIGNFGLLKNMSHPKGSPLLFRAGAIASLVLLVLLLLVPCAVLFICGESRIGFPARAILRRARDLLGALGHGLAVGGPGLLAAAAPAGQTGGPAQHASRVGRVAGTAECRGFPPGRRVALAALKSDTDGRPSSGSRKMQNTNHQEESWRLFNLFPDIV